MRVMSRIPTSPFASCVRRACSVCSAMRLFVCLELTRIGFPFHTNLNHQYLLLGCLYTAIALPSCSMVLESPEEDRKISGRHNPRCAVTCKGKQPTFVTGHQIIGFASFTQRQEKIIR